jgi:hypothetical protein
LTGPQPPQHYIAAHQHTGNRSTVSQSGPQHDEEPLDDRAAPSCEPKPPHEDLPTPEALMLIWGTEYADDWHLFRLAMKELIVRDIIRPVTEIHVGRGGKTTTSIQLLMNHQQTPRIPMSLRSFPDIFKLACGTKANTSVGIFAYRIKDFFHHPTYVHRNVIPALASKGLYDNEEYQTTHFPNRIKTHTRYFPIEAGMLRARVIAERLEKMFSPPGELSLEQELRAHKTSIAIALRNEVFANIDREIAALSETDGE